MFCFNLSVPCTGITMLCCGGTISVLITSEQVGRCPTVTPELKVMILKKSWLGSESSTVNIESCSCRIFSPVIELLT